MIKSSMWAWNGKHLVFVAEIKDGMARCYSGKGSMCGKGYCIPVSELTEDPPYSVRWEAM